MLGCNSALKGEWVLPCEGTCVDGSTMSNKEHHNPEDVRPHKQCCESTESHTVNVRPSFNIRRGHVQTVACRGALGHFFLNQSSIHIY